MPEARPAANELRWLLYVLRRLRFGISNCVLNSRKFAGNLPWQACMCLHYGKFWYSSMGNVDDLQLLPLCAKPLGVTPSLDC